MARKTTPRSGARPDAKGVIDRMEFSMAIPPTPSQARPGSSVSLEMVNVFGEPVAEEAGSAGSARLRLTAWVNNVSYVKDVWVDAYLMDPSGAVAHGETLILTYQQGAGGGGDFFVLDAPIPSKGPGTTAVGGLQYRLYYQIGDTVYSEGVLHEESLGPPASGTTAKPAPKAPARPAAKVVAADGRTPAKATATAKAAPEKRAAPPAEAPAKRTRRSRPSA